MYNPNQTRKFTFRCEKCKEILSSEFENEEDIADIVEDQLWLECPNCDGKALLLRN